MGKKETNIIYRRLIRSYLSSVISITLILLLVGIVSLFLVNARAVSNYFKENISISAFVRMDASNEMVEELKGRIEKEDYSKEVVVITKEQGMREMRDLLGDSFMDVFDMDPIPLSLDIRLNADYVSKDSMMVTESKLMNEPLITEVVYQESLMDVLNSNIEKIGLMLGVFVIFLLFISTVLIGSTVRLNVYAKRFTIHTMRLVGAKKSFIIKPFVIQSVFQGLISGFLAVLGLIGVIFMIKNKFYQMFLLFDMRSMAFVLIFVILLGVVICVLSTIIVVNRIISISKDELYY